MDETAKRILVVEDDESMRDLFKTILTTQGFSCDFVVKGSEAAPRVRELRPDLIVLDFMLPERGGFDVLKDFQADEELKDIPILVVTARQLASPVVREIEAEPNVKGYFEKPLKQRLFIAKLHEILKTKGPDTRTTDPWLNSR